MEHKNGFPQRIRMVISLLGGVKMAEKKLGISNSQLSKYQRGEADPTLGKLKKISEGSGRTISWLVGDSTLSGEIANPYLQIPIFDMQLSAGTGAFIDRAEIIDRFPITQNQLMLHTGKTDAKGLGMFKAKGDSMSPTIEDGDLVMIDLDDTRVRDGIFAYIHDDMARIKRFQHTLSGINVFSDNREIYQPEIVSGEQLNDIQIIGRGIWHMGRI